MANRIGAFGYMECSAKMNDGVREVFEMATRAALQARRGKKSNKCFLLWARRTELKPQVGVQNVCKCTHPFLKLERITAQNFLLIFFYCSLISRGGVSSVFKKLQRTWTFSCFVFDVLSEFCDIKATPTCQMLSCDSKACQSSAQHNCWDFFFFISPWNRAEKWTWFVTCVFQFYGLF